MIIKPISDLHCEFNKIDFHEELINTISDDTHDVLALAGDTFVPGIGALSIFEQLSRLNKHVVFVLGNHEFYNAESREAILAIAKEIDHTFENVHFLENTAVTIDGQKFFGCTSWFPKPFPMPKSYRRMNDFIVIPDFTDWVYDVNEQSRVAIQNLVDKDTVVITHHAPTNKSVSHHYSGDELNCFYINGFEEVLLDTSPKLWIHGHMHMSNDYMDGETHVINNAYGYYKYDVNPTFNPNLKIEI